MSGTMLSQIQMLEPLAKSYYEGVSNYIVVLSDGHKVCLSKQSIQGLERKCLSCGQMVKTFRVQNTWAKYDLSGAPHKDFRKRK